MSGKTHRLGLFGVFQKRLKSLRKVRRFIWVVKVAAARFFDEFGKRPAFRKDDGPTRGQFYFAKAGFVGVNGDAWAEKPFLYVYCAKPVEGFILDEFERFESEALVSIERHFLKEEKMALSLSLIAQSNAKKALPDLVLGLPQSQDAQIPAQYQKSSETLLIDGAKISVHLLRTTRFPLSMRKFLGFLLLNKTKNEVSRDI